MTDPVYSSCSSKVRYRTERVAAQRAQAYGQTYYACARCGGYHCSSQNLPRQVRRNIASRVRDDLALEIARTADAINELIRKKVAGPLLDQALEKMEKLKASRGW